MSPSLAQRVPEATFRAGCGRKGNGETPASGLPRVRVPGDKAGIVPGKQGWVEVALAVLGCGFGEQSFWVTSMSGQPVKRKYSLNSYSLTQRLRKILS